MNDHEALDKQLSRAWQALSPPAELEAKVRARLAAAGLATTSQAGALPRAMTRAGAGWRALRSSGGVGVVVGAALLGLGFVAGQLVRSPAGVNEPTPRLPVAVPAAAAPAPAASPAPAVSPAPLTGSRPTDAPSADAATPPAASAPSTQATASRHAPVSSERAAVRARPQRAAPARSTPDAANGELLLLERAERALRARNADLALVLADQLEERYPSSLLHEERSAIELMALCQAGSSRAIMLGEVFARRYPGSVYAERITDECGPAPTNRSGLDIDGPEGGKNAKPEKP